MSRRLRQRGFALVLVLVLVVLAGAMLAGLARRSLVGAVESQEALEELQRRWAVESCRQTLLGHVERLLDEAERGRPRDDKAPMVYANKPVRELRIACRLAEVDYDLVLTDEQAKANINTLLQMAGREKAQSALKRLAGPSKGRSGAAALRTLVVGKNTPPEIARLSGVGGYGQMFPEAAGEDLVGASASGLAASVTCWGDGRVNLRRAPAAVVEEVCEKAVGRSVTGALLAAREKDPYRKVSAILADLDGVDAARRARIGQVVTDRSACHGLWVIARARQRVWPTLAIGVSELAGQDQPQPDEDEQRVSQRFVFAW